ncbi:VOC family protein [Streptomyces sp. NPDC056161]|uniref:VOC family protein n=1 Tax=Streptomyces sp. NPDC056161 TaxID=3345732 RepID=UPI0035D95979
MTLPATLDHLVIACPDLADGVRRFAGLCGVQPVPGGSHPNRGTANHLVGMTNADAPGSQTYIEIIGPDPQQDTSAMDRLGLDVHTVTSFRLHTWAVRPADFDAQVARAAADGIDIGTVHDAARTTPSGDVLAWRLTRREPLPLAGCQPFLIDWGTSTHPSTRLEPVLTLEEFEVRSPDAAGTGAALARLGAAVPVVPSSAFGLRAVFTGPTGRFEVTSA